MATQSERITNLETAIGGIAAMLEKLTASPAPETSDTATVKAGRKTATDKTADTRRKAGTITRNLDPVTVDTDDERFPAFRVIGANASGPLFNGARILPVDANGREQRSWPLSAVAVAAEVIDELSSAVDTVEKRAKIGQYVEKPARTK